MDKLNISSPGVADKILQALHLAKMAAQTAENDQLTKEEADIYDRQIRLWGLEAQNRLRHSKILIVGLSGLGAEVAKNLMLAGVKSMTLMDDKSVTVNEQANQFLVAPDSIGQNRALASEIRTRDLNPMVTLEAVEGSVADQPMEFFKFFDLVVLIDQTYSTIILMNKICRKLGIRFQAGGVFGWNGYAFFDFNNHIFLLPKPKETIVTETLDDEPSPKKLKTQSSVEAVTLEDEEDQKIKKHVSFSSFEAALNVEWQTKKFLRKAKRTIPSSYFPIRALLHLKNEKETITDEEFLEAWKKELANAGQDESNQAIQPQDLTFFSDPQLSPACAILGGFIGQEGIKAISQNDVPLQNLFLYSALDTSGIIVKLPPE